MTRRQKGSSEPNLPSYEDVSDCSRALVYLKNPATVAPLGRSSTDNTLCGKSWK